MCTSSVSKVIYHKFSHGAAFYTVNGKNVNVMLEYPRTFDISCGMFSNIISLVLRESYTDLEKVCSIWHSVSDGQKTCSSKGESLIGCNKYSEQSDFLLPPR